MRVRVGLIANPDAARDVRRITSLARTVDVHERVNLVARVVRGLAAVGVDEVLAMVEPCRVAERAWSVLAGAGESAGRLPSLRPAGSLAADARGTAATATRLRDSGVGCVVTIGGDGTHRAVAAGWPEVVFASLPGGTNNAFARRVEPTVLGLAAGLFARDADGYASYAHRVARLDIGVSGPSRPPENLSALVDVASVRGQWVGARAMWDATLLEEAVVTRADPTLCGLAGLAGIAHPAAGAREVAVHLRFGSPGTDVLAPLGPGQLATVRVASVRALQAGDEVAVQGDHSTLAFDGEREVVLRPGDRATIRVEANGPRVLDAEALVRAAAMQGALALPPSSTTELTA